MNNLMLLNRAMQYLEENLDAELDVQSACRMAGCSEYHFRRMFSFLAGMPLGEYVRRRRLSLAAEILREGETKVVDLALCLGYDSPDAFSKAFAAFHGVTPSEVRRKPETAVKTFSPMTFQLTVRGGTEMETRIVEKPAFRIVGAKKQITLQFEGENPQMEELNRSLTMENILELKALCDIEPMGMLSVSHNFADRMREGTTLDQYLGVATTKPAPEGYAVLEVEPSTWAVFTSVGPFPNALQDTWASIAAEWFPSTDYQMTGGPELLWYGGQDFTVPDFRTEIWIPVTR